MYRFLIPVSLLLASCGARAADSQVETVVLKGVPRTPTPHATSTSASLNITPLRLEEVACRAETPAIYQSPADGAEAIRLCDGGLSKCFMEVDNIQSTPMQVSIGLGVEPRGFLQVPFRGARFWGFIATPSIALFPRVATRFGGFFHATHVHAIEGQRGALKVKASPGSKVHSALDLEAVLGCDDLAFREDQYLSGEELAERVSATGPEQSARLVPGAIPLSTAPRLAPVATIEAGADEGVTAYQSKHGFRFIVLWTETGQVFGWVPQSSVLPVGIGAMWGSSGGGKAFVPIATEWKGRRCAHEVSILARIGTDLFDVGSIPRGVVFSVGDLATRDLRELVLRHQRYSDFADPPTFRTPEVIRVTADAALVVSTKSIESCERDVEGERRAR